MRDIYNHLAGILIKRQRDHMPRILCPVAPIRLKVHVANLTCLARDLRSETLMVRMIDSRNLKSCLSFKDGFKVMIDRCIAHYVLYCFVTFYEHPSSYA